MPHVCYSVKSELDMTRPLWFLVYSNCAQILKGKCAHVKIIDLISTLISDDLNTMLAILFSL